MDRALITKYFNGQCTRAEATEMLEWFQTAEGQQYLENELDRDTQFFGEVGEYLDYPEPDSDQLFDRILANQSSADINKIRSRTIGTQWKKVAGIILVLGILSVLVGIFATDSKMIVETKTGEKKTVVLPDNSKIILHSNSSLEYLSSFEKREVGLEGEAYFEVEHTEDRPFIVFIENSYVKVLGTKFVVSEFSGDGRLEVAVRSGRVELGSHISGAVKELEAPESNQQKTIEITDNEVGIKNRDSDPFITDSTHSEEIFDWVRGMMIFRNTPLKYVLSELENRYGVECVLRDPELKKQKFTSSFDDETLPEVLKVLTLSLDITYEKVGNKIFFSD